MSTEGPLFVQHVVSVDPHRVEIIPVGSSASRIFYRVVCYTCQTVVHERTIAPDLQIKSHLERPLSGREPLALPLKWEWLSPSGPLSLAVDGWCSRCEKRYRPEELLLGTMPEDNPLIMVCPGCGLEETHHVR